MDFDGATPIVVALAEKLVARMRRIDPAWERAYWRFESSASEYGSNASYRCGEKVTLVSALREDELFDTLNDLGRQLWHCETDPARRFLVCLLIVGADADYEIKFDYADQQKWCITKLEGHSGLPE